MILNIIYNPIKLHQNEFFAQLLTNKNNSSWEFSPNILLRDYNIGYLNRCKKLYSVALKCSVTIAIRNVPSRVFKTMKTHIDYILTENVPEDKCF